MNPAPTRSLAQGRSPRAVVARFTRWLLALKVQRRGRLWSYPLLLAAAPLLLLASAAVGVLVHPWVGGVVFALTLATRSVTGYVAAGHRPRVPLLADVVLLLAAARAATTRSVQWRGRTLDVDATGRLVAAES